MTEALFPRTLEDNVSKEEYMAHHELAYWTVSALETALHKTDISRRDHSHIVQEYNQVSGTTKAITQQGVNMGYLEPTIE